MRPLPRIAVWMVVLSSMLAVMPSASAQLAPWGWGLGGGAAPQAFAPEAFADFLGSGHPPHPAVVRIIAPENGGTSMGSGALVDINPSQGLVLTNWHVIRNAKSAVLVQFPDGFQTAGTVIRHDEPWDLAAIAIWRPKVAPIPIAPAPPAIGEPLSILGYGKGPFRSETGACTQYLAPGTGYPLECVELAARARQGDSGGPILNARGELAGILFGQAQGRTIGACSTRVRAFLATVGSHGITPEAAAAMAAATGRSLPQADATGPAVAGAAPLAPPPPAESVASMPRESPPAAIAMAPEQAPLASQPASSTPAVAVAATIPAGPAAPASAPLPAAPAAPEPVPVATSGEPVPASIGPPPSAWGDLPEGRPVGHSFEELLDLRRNGQAMLVAAGGVVLAVAGLKTVFGGPRPRPARRRRPIVYEDDFDDD